MYGVPPFARREASGFRHMKGCGQAARPGQAVVSLTARARPGGFGSFYGAVITTGSEAGPASPVASMATTTTA